MELAHRYAALLTAPEGMLREAPADGFSDDRSELELQAHWFAGDFGCRFVDRLKMNLSDNEQLMTLGVFIGRNSVKQSVKKSVKINLTLKKQ